MIQAQPYKRVKNTALTATIDAMVPSPPGAYLITNNPKTDEIAMRPTISNPQRLR